MPLAKLKTIVPKVMAVSPSIVRFAGFQCVFLRAFDALQRSHWDPRVTVEWGSQPGVVFDGIFLKPDRKRTRVEPCQRCD